MEKLNKIIVGLECCGADNRCLSCPYKDVGHPCDLDCIKALSGDAVELIERLKRQLKYARAERDAATARMARLIGEAEARWIELGEKPMPNDYGEYPPEFPREGM